MCAAYYIIRLAALSVYSTYPDLFRGRTVNHFIDNTVAQAAFVHGYSGKVELAKVVNLFYLQRPPASELLCSSTTSPVQGMTIRRNVSRIVYNTYCIV